MYLAIKEILHEKLRYGLIIGMISLIIFLIYVMTSVAIGLAGENTQAIDGWNVQSITMDKSVNLNLSQSSVQKSDIPSNMFAKENSVIGQIPTIVRSKGRKTISSMFFGINQNQFLYKNLAVQSGGKFTKSNAVVVDSSFHDNGYQLGDKIKINDYKKEFTIVGFSNNQKFNVAPALYGTLSAWRDLHGYPSTFAGSAVLSKKNSLKLKSSNYKSYSIQTFINKLPGYSAENSTFIFMIVFLMIISLILIAVFLYILTIQSLPVYAVLRAQGIPAKKLSYSVFSQSVILILAGIFFGAILTAILNTVMPQGIPVKYDFPLLLSVSLGILIMGLIGAFIPAQKISHVDPIQGIGG